MGFIKSMISPFKRVTGNGGGSITIGSKEGDETKLSQNPKTNIEAYRNVPENVSDKDLLSIQEKRVKAEVNAKNRQKYAQELIKYIKANEIDYRTNAEYQKACMVVLEALAKTDRDFAEALQGYRFGVESEKVQLNAFQSAHGDAVKFNPF